jgi:hypothetical protein
MGVAEQRTNVIIDYPPEDIQKSLHLPGHVGEIARNIRQRIDSQDELVLHYDSDGLLIETALGRLPFGRADKIVIGGGLAEGCVQTARALLAGAGYQKVKVDPEITISLLEGLFNF